MNCQSVEEKLTLYLVEELEPGERAALEAHLESCAACAATAREFGRLPAALHPPGAPPSPPPVPPPPRGAGRPPRPRSGKLARPGAELVHRPAGRLRPAGHGGPDHPGARIFAGLDAARAGHARGRAGERLRPGCLDG